VILPMENEPNVKEDLPPEMLEDVKIHFVRTVEEALDIALGKFDKPVRSVTGGPLGEDRPPVAGPVH
jgi:ATP-dependent Lon protease